MPHGNDWKFAFRALRSRNYRLFFGGQGISLIGTWMTRIATSWLVYRLTGSAFLLGVVSFAGQIPTFFLTPIAGVWVDRWDRHRTLLVTQIISMLQSFALAALTLTGVITVWQVIVLQLLQGAVNSFDMPARQAFLIQMVDDPRDLSNAIALNSSIVNGARLIGPAAAGLIIAGVGEGLCFLIDGISYLFVIFSLLAMVVVVRRPKRGKESVMEELGEGWRYVWGSVPIRSILILVSLVSLVGMPYTVLMPVFASEILHGGPHTLGWLMAATGVGAFGSAIALTLRKSVVGLGRSIAVAAGVFGAGLVVFSLSRSLWLSLAFLLFTGYGFLQLLAGSNTVLQTIVHEEKRGRVMAYHALAFQGVAPFGSLIAGAIASRIGAPHTLALGGILCIASAIWFASQLPAIRKVTRPIYRERGIIPEVASGLQSASLLESPPED